MTVNELRNMNVKIRGYAIEFFRKREWEETEKSIIIKEEVEQVLASLQSEPARKRQTGFVTGGAEL